MSNTITGMVKIFYTNYLKTLSNTITASSGNSTANLIDGDKSTTWESTGSNDSVIESIEFVFNESQTISRIAFILMNWKYFKFFYWDGSAWQDFSGVFSTIEASTANVATYDLSLYESGIYGWDSGAIDNSLSTRYFEFTPVSTTKVKVEIYETITADQEKSIAEIYIGKEIGTFTNDIACRPNKFDSVARKYKVKMLELSNGGKIRYEKSDKYQAKIKLKNIWETEDQTLINNMFEFGEFAIYPCGAVNEYTTKGWTIDDFYEVVIDGDQDAFFSVGRDLNVGVEYDFQVFEK